MNKYTAATVVLWNLAYTYEQINSSYVYVVMPIT